MHIISRIFFIEGLPGSGKSTLTQKLGSLITNSCITNEGDLNSVDLQWQAILTKEEFANLIKKYEADNDRIMKNSLSFLDYVLIAYTKLGYYPDQNELMSYLASHELFDNRSSLDKYIQVYLASIDQFVKENKDKNKIYIFDSALLQAHLSELFCYRGMSENKVCDFLEDYYCRLEPLNPLIIYLDVDVRKTLIKTSLERTSDNNIPNWIDMVIDWANNTAFSKKCNLKGQELVCSLLEKRKEIELRFLKNKKALIFSDEDYDNRYKNIIASIMK